MSKLNKMCALSAGLATPFAIAAIVSIWPIGVVALTATAKFFGWYNPDIQFFIIIWPMALFVTIGFVVMSSLIICGIWNVLYNLCIAFKSKS